MDDDDIRRIIGVARKEGRTALTEVVAKEIFRACGLVVVATGGSLGDVVDNWD